MLSMIEINLLPPEFRVQERTPLGLFLVIVAGICMVCTAGIFYINLSQQLTQAKEVNQQKTNEKATWQQKKDEIEQLQKEISVAEKRQQTIIEISQTKIMWSQKLCQLGRILVDYPQFWMERLTMDRSGGLQTTIYCVNEDLQKVAEFREAVMGDTSFWYHFSKFEASNYVRTLNVRVNAGAGAPQTLANTMITFNVRWPLK